MAVNPCIKRREREVLAQNRRINMVFSARGAKNQDIVGLSQYKVDDTATLSRCGSLIKQTQRKTERLVHSNDEKDTNDDSLHRFPLSKLEVDELCTAIHTKQHD